jgi:Hemerythrin HHE cation binding domain
MSTTPTAPPQDASPIDDFSQCHAGILGHLQALGDLPTLLPAAARMRQIAAETLAFFRDAVFEHHAQEEAELFPAVLASATKGEEHARVRAMVDLLTTEHRRIEAAWTRLEPHLKALSKGRDDGLDVQDIHTLVAAYRAHAQYEEDSFLPLAQTILGRDGNHMAALGLSLHLRHVMPQVMERFGSRI